MVLVGVYIVFHNAIFHNIYICSNECNVLFYHIFLYILFKLGLGHWTLSGQLIQFFFSRNLHIVFDSYFYVSLIGFCLVDPELLLLTSLLILVGLILFHHFLSWRRNVLYLLLEGCILSPVTSFLTLWSIFIFNSANVQLIIFKLFAITSIKRMLILVFAFNPVHYKFYS